MLKRLVYLLLGIDGIIDIETKPEIKLVVIRWRIKNDKYITGHIDISSIASKMPKGWSTLLITERW
jgi:hypothetical protein